jgi:hypothetical protein
MTRRTMTIRDPGWGMTTQQIEDFYLRWREWMLVASTHDAVVVANVKHGAFFADLTDRLKGDTWWKLQCRSDPVMMYNAAVPYDDLYFHVAGRGLLKPAELLGNVGFGRMTAKAPTRDGVRPWGTATPGPDVKPITPDTDTIE